jgi:hypothetical protein
MKMRFGLLVSGGRAGTVPIHQPGNVAPLRIKAHDSSRSRCCAWLPQGNIFGDRTR